MTSTDGPDDNWGDRPISWATDTDIDTYLSTVITSENQYCQVAIGFKYCGMGNICPDKTTPDYRSKTYERYLDSWSDNKGDFSYITKIGEVLNTLSKSNFHLTWLLRFEYEVAINFNLFGKNYINVRQKYCKAFLNCRVKMLEKFDDKTKLKFIFHPVVGDTMASCPLITDQNNCSGVGVCMWNDPNQDPNKAINCNKYPTNSACKCITDPNREQDINNEDWINLFNTVGHSTLENTKAIPNFFPDILGQSQVFGLKEQYKMAISNFKYWRLRTGMETIFSETSVSASTILGCGEKQDSILCTTLEDLMDSVRIYNCVDYLVYINSTENIAETSYSSAIQKMNEQIQKNWNDFIKNYAIKSNN